MFLTIQNVSLWSDCLGLEIVDESELYFDFRQQMRMICGWNSD